MCGKPCPSLHRVLAVGADVFLQVWYLAAVAALAAAAGGLIRLAGIGITLCPSAGVFIAAHVLPAALCRAAGAQHLRRKAVGVPHVIHYGVSDQRQMPPQLVTAPCTITHRSVSGSVMVLQLQIVLAAGQDECLNISVKHLEAGPAACMDDRGMTRQRSCRNDF